ncbi:uncharacterized protein VTP21DRAFT_1622 [Calcarisporiella thermophila]|uniref:uncharacterized protein n=1 Tax=Calcarisporiella thermophila TaxID=911321 RepID=UPI0037448E92
MHRRLYNNILLNFRSFDTAHKQYTPARNALCLQCSRSGRKIRYVHSGNTPRSPPLGAATVSVEHAENGADEYLRLMFDDVQVWKDHVPRYNLSAGDVFETNWHGGAKARIGLFGNPDLAQPEGFDYAADKALHRATLIVQRLYRAGTSDGELRKVVKNLDRLSDVLCSVIDTAEFIRSAHPDVAMREAANRAYEKLCTFMNTLNTNVQLYQILKQVLESPHIVRQLTLEERQVAQVFFRDFEKSGIHLPHAQRTEFVTLCDRIITLGRQFMQGNPRATSHIRVWPSSRLEGLSPTYIKGVMRPKENAAFIPTLPWDSQMVLKYVRDEEVRKMMYMATNSATEESVDVLEGLLRTRSKLANLLGQKSYAHMFLSDKMAKNPENVRMFLRTLAEHNHPKAQQDLQLLKQAKRTYTGTTDAPFHAWDHEFFAEIVTSNNAMRPTSPISPYFSVGSVMQGLSRLFHNLYGISLQPSDIQPGETWHDDVRKLDVVDEVEGRIGTIYLDLFSRHGKMSNAAHYTVRCSRRVDDDDELGDFHSEELDEGLRQKGLLSGPYNEGVPLRNRSGRYQLPIVVLICDFSRPRRNHPSLLSWQETETLFHEMGHAMHSMLGRTDFHNVAGTRCPTDFVELPSILMEHFAAHPHVLQLFARHYQSREPLPPRLLESHRKARVFQALDTQSQIIMALLDQSYHGPLASNFSSTEELHSLQRSPSIGIYPPVEGTRWQAQFGHLFGYGAGYYSYLFDRVLARRIWTRCFEKDPLSREMGERLRDEVLKWGGGRDPWECVGGVLQDEEVARGDEKSMIRVGEWGVGEN